jgi:hypothetical protein
MSPNPLKEITPQTPTGGASLGVARRRGRRALLGVYYAIILGICIASTVEITRQIFFVKVVAPPYHTCREGLLALSTAVERARRAAPGTDGEDAAISRFREALEPDWSRRDAVAASCRGSERDEGALDAIERLRYAEEHAVRREAGDLAPLRRRVQAIVEKDLSPPPTP